MSELISIGGAIARLAQAAPDRPAITFGDDVITRSALDATTNRLARFYAKHAEVQGRMVTIALPNSPELLLASVAVWKLGGTPHLISAKMPPVEQEALVELADPALIVGEAPSGGRPHLSGQITPDPDISTSPLPDIISPSWKAICSGGSTGRPKIIVDAAPGVVDPHDKIAGLLPDLTQIVCGPLYHNMAFLWGARGLHIGQHLVLLPRFDPEQVLRNISAHSAHLVALTPTMMRRIWELDPVVRQRYDVSSLKFIVHTGAACPEWLKRSYIEWLGAKRIWETYSGTERIAGTAIRGDEWLAHPGSVGRVRHGRVKVLDEHGDELPSRTVGEIFMQSDREDGSHRYIGSDNGELGGWQSLGDMGSVDEDGYLYINDRRTDLIIRGGANIYPAEVEAALDRHPDVFESVVVGLPDDDLGQVVHAVVRHTGTLTQQQLHEYALTQLAKYKLPTSYELTARPLRDELGKVRRSSFREETRT